MISLTGRDLIILVAILFSSALFFFMVRYMGNTLIDKMGNTTQISSVPKATESLESVKTNLTNRLDYILFSVFMALLIVSIIVSWLVSGHPIFMILYILVWLLGIVISAIFSNIWQDISSASIFGSNITAFPLTNHIMCWLPLYIGVVGFIGVIVMFGKPYHQE